MNESEIASRGAEFTASTEFTAPESARPEYTYEPASTNERDAVAAAEQIVAEAFQDTAAETAEQAEEYLRALMSADMGFTVKVRHQALDGIAREAELV